MRRHRVLFLRGATRCSFEHFTSRWIENSRNFSNFTQVFDLLVYQTTMSIYCVVFKQNTPFREKIPPEVVNRMIICLDVEELKTHFY